MSSRGDPIPPEDVVPLPCECHAKVLEIPKDRAEGPQVVDTEHEVKPAKVDAEAADGEVLLANVHGHIAGHYPARHAISVGHHHAHAGAGGRQADAAHQVHMDEVVR